MQYLGIVIADFDTQLSSKVDPGDTSVTIQSVTDDDGVQIPDGKYYFNADGDNSKKEHFVGDLVASTKTISNIQSVSRQGVLTTGFARGHRVGAAVRLTDFATLFYLNALLKGDIGFDSATKIGYSADPALSSGDVNKFATVKYVNDIAIAGAPDASTSTKGIVKLSYAPVSPTDPTAVGDNDPRVPTQTENDALSGTSGTPSSTNKYVTENDTSNNATKTASTISFDSGSKEIRDSGNGFVTAQFRAGDSITVSGSSSNDGTYTMVSVAAGVIVVAESLVTEASGATVTLTVPIASKVIRTKSDGTIPYSALPAGANILGQFTAGENITLGNAVVMGDGTYSNLPNTTLNTSNSTNAVLCNTTSIWSAMTFTVPVGTNVSLRSVSFSSRQTQNGGQPAATTTVSIRATSGGNPTGLDLDSATNTDNSYSGSMQQRTYTFSGNVVLTQGATYALVFRTSAGSYEAFGNRSSTDSGSTWSTPTLNQTPAHVISSQELLTAGLIWKTNATNNDARVNNFIGFATESITAGNQGLVSFGPLVTQSGLTAGSKYYLTDTAGAISTTAGTYKKYVGIATKTTQLNINKGPNLGNWTSPISDGVSYQALTDGFVSVWGDSTGSSVSIIIYTDSASTPTTVRARTQAADYSSAFCAVKKGDYVIVDVDTTGATYNIYWIPLQ